MRKPGDPRKKGTTLSERDKAYCQLRADPSIPKQECYMQIFTCANKSSANVLSRILEKRPEVKAEILRLQRLTESASTMTRTCKREFLAKIVRGNLLTMTDEEYGALGEDFGLGKRKLSKLQAIDLDNKMAGHYAPEKTEQNITSSVMVLPAEMSLEEWEKQAGEGQAALRKL